MSNPLSRLATRVAYGASQLPRIAWYVGHSLALRRLSEEVRRRDGKKARPRAHTNAPVPDHRRLYADMAILLQQDLANIEAGLYPLPADHDGSLLAMLYRSRLFFEDLPEVHRRRDNHAHNEVLNEGTRGKRPRYYLQNFHFQSGGWMTDDSARRYDTQVEVLFNGTANATRRQALPQLHEVFAGRDQRKLRLLDVGCGTGRFLDSLKQVWPRLPALGLDMSEPYGAEVIRTALLVRMKKGHLALTARNHTLAISTWEDFAVGTLKALPVEDLKKIAEDLFPNCKYDAELDMMQGANYGDAPKSIGIGPPPFDPATHLRTFDPTTINARAPVVSTPPPPEKKSGAVG